MNEFKVADLVRSDESGAEIVVTGPGKHDHEFSGVVVAKSSEDKSVGYRSSRWQRRYFSVIPRSNSNSKLRCLSCRHTQRWEVEIGLHSKLPWLSHPSPQENVANATCPKGADSFRLIDTESTDHCDTCKYYELPRHLATPKVKVEEVPVTPEAPNFPACPTCIHHKPRAGSPCYHYDCEPTVGQRYERAKRPIEFEEVILKEGEVECPECGMIINRRQSWFSDREAMEEAMENETGPGMCADCFTSRSRLRSPPYPPHVIDQSEKRGAKDVFETLFQELENE